MSVGEGRDIGYNGADDLYLCDFIDCGFPDGQEPNQTPGEGEDEVDKDEPIVDMEVIEVIWVKEGVPDQISARLNSLRCLPSV